jgi:hypothetical protein
MLAELSCRFRLSRAALARRRAFHRILKTRRLARVRFGGHAPSERRFVDRRCEVRHPLQVPVYLRPAQVRGLSVSCDESVEPLLGVTQNISLSGLGLVHDHPLPGPWFLAEFDVFDDEPLILLVQVRWTQELDPYAFRTGGRIAGLCRPVA